DRDHRRTGMPRRRDSWSQRAGGARARRASTGRCARAARDRSGAARTVWCGGPGAGGRGGRRARGGRSNAHPVSGAVGMSLLVTGADGFIGRALVAARRGAGVAVRGSVRNASRTGSDTVVCGDLATADWAAALDGVDAVVHLAAHSSDGVPELL